MTVSASFECVVFRRDASFDNLPSSTPVSVQVDLGVSYGTTTTQSRLDLVLERLNADPVAVNDTASVVEGQTLSITAAELLANGQALTITQVSSSDGNAQFDGTTLTYVPAVDPSTLSTGQSTTEAYTVTDGNVGTATRLLIVTINGLDDGPSVALTNVRACIGGFNIVGMDEGNLSNLSVSSAGDVNGVGVEGLIVDSARNDGSGFDTGAAFVVLGKTDGTTVD